MQAKERQGLRIMLTNDLLELNRRVAFALRNVGFTAAPPSGLSPRLVFPDLAKGKTRFSEQESRLLWCNALQETSYYYAVEAPTTKKYVQKGKTPTRARTDVALYTANSSKLQRVANVEFKAGSSTEEQIRKDLEKLIRENLQGNWFHTLHVANRKTITKLFKKFVNAFGKCAKYANHDIDIVFSFCVVPEKQLISRRFEFKVSSGSFKAYATEFFSDSEDWDME